MLWIRGRSLSAAVAAGILASSTLSAQTAAFNREMVVLDPAHGGTDGGARINDHLEEKDVTLAVTTRLRSLLAARGFTVVSTRESDPDAALSNDQRAATANKAHAVACLVIHATASGNGVYIGTSTIGSSLASIPQITPVTRNPGGSTFAGGVPWDRAQEAYVPQSLGLANQIGTALKRAQVPLAMGRAALRPLDNLMCPAISIEMGPLHSGSDETAVSDENYQQRVAEAIAGALIFWKNQAQPPQYLTVPATSAQPGAGL